MADSDTSIHAHITDLITEEKDLRAKRERGEVSRNDEATRLRDLEVALDQCWDLLRQRQAKRDAGADPGEAAVRSADVVENYRN